MEDMPKDRILIKSSNAIGNYSIATIEPNSRLLFTSGQIAYGHLNLGIKDQTKHTLKNLLETLEAAGANLKKVLKITIFLTDMKNFQTVNSIYGDFWNQQGETDFPARSCVEVSALPAGALIEIDAIAMLN